MSQLKPMIIVILMLTSALTGCTSNGNENIVQIEINSPAEGDWIEGQVQILISTKITESEEIEIWINDNYYSTEELGIVTDFDIDTSYFSDETAAPVNLNIELRHENKSISEVNVTALFPQQMTFWSSEDIQPEFNLDGELLFKSSKGLDDGMYEIYHFNPGVNTPTKISTEQEYHGYPGPSPEGTHVVFNSRVIDEAGNSQMEIFTANISTGETYRLTYNPSFDDSGRWSPDGSEIIFYSNRDGSMDLWKISVNESGYPLEPAVKVLESDAREHCGRWSFDGNYIVYESDKTGVNHLWMITSDGYNETQLTFDENQNGYPAWHPSGDYIVYNKQTSTSSNLHILSLLDGETKRLTMNQMGVDAHPTWSSDGKYIAFHSDRAGNFDIWIMEIPLTI
ncbi:MAG: TolB family protein [Candidatus Thalassarchaeaceae archaeon]